MLNINVHIKIKMNKMYINVYKYKFDYQNFYTYGTIIKDFTIYEGRLI